MDDFLNFLRTAAIRNVRVGARQSEVRAALGPPHDTSATKPSIWKYDNTELTFHGDDVMMIAMSVQAEAEAVRQRLDDDGPAYEPYGELTYDAQTAFVIPSSDVTLTLDLERPLARAFAT